LKYRRDRGRRDATVRSRSATTIGEIRPPRVQARAGSRSII